MAVIIREMKEIEGKAYKVKVYKSRPGKLVTDAEKKQAEQLDTILEERISKLEKQLKDSGLLSLKGRRGKVLKLWHEVGKNLQFIMDTSVVAAEDRDFVWRAVYDHVNKLHEGPIPERARNYPETSHFSYCYKLSQFSWEFVEMVGDWTSWSEFFDRRETTNDPRIIEWLGKKARVGDVSGRQDWLRPLTKEIHKKLGGKDTTIFSEEELYERLDMIFSELNKNE